MKMIVEKPKGSFGFHIMMEPNNHLSEISLLFSCLLQHFQELTWVQQILKSISMVSNNSGAICSDFGFEFSLKLY